MFNLYLPRWFIRSQCPWCMEQTHLLSMARNLDMLDSPFEDRLTRLSAVAEGLDEDWCHTAPDDGSVPRLGAQATLKLPTNATPLQVLFACASAVQQLRQLPQKSLDKNAFPAPRLLAKRVFSDNYTEMLIWISLLRALIAAETESELKSHLLSVANGVETDVSSKYARHELALSALRGHLGGRSAGLKNFLDSVSLSGD